MARLENIGTFFLLLLFFLFFKNKSSSFPKSDPL